MPVDKLYYSTYRDFERDASLTVNKIIDTLGEGAASNAVVIVQNPIDLQGDLDSTCIYIIDGVIDFTGTGIQIKVPKDGLNIKGYSYNVSKLICSDNNYELFVEDPQGSGSINIDKVTLTVSGSGSELFGDIPSFSGEDFIQITNTNFDNCTSLGNLIDYRQYVELDTGRFGGTPELTFSGNWDGVRISTSIVRGVSDLNALFKSGTNLQFSGRFVTDINCRLPSAGALLDFSGDDFLQEDSLILSGCFITRLGTINTADTGITPNISSYNLKSNWTGNTGIPNTTKYLKGYISTEDTTSVNGIGVYYPLDGTFSVSNSSHLSMTSDGIFEILSGWDTYKITGNFTLESAPNGELDLRVVLSTDGGITFPIVIDHTRRIVNSLSGSRDVAILPVDFIYDLKKGDKLRIEVENNTSTSNITAELDSFLTLTAI